MITKVSPKEIGKNLILVFIGNICLSIGFTAFVQANGFLSGGAYAVAGIIDHFVPAIPFAWILLLVNIPFFIWAFFELDRRFVLYTGLGMVIQSVCIAIFEKHLPGFHGNLLLSAAVGGILIGLGSGLAIHGRGGCGGLDLTAVIANKKLGISVGTFSIIINLILMVISSFIFGLEIVLYTCVIIVAGGKMINFVLEGISRKSTAMIITDKGKEIGDHITEKISRGVTIVPCYGAYTGEEKEILYVVVNMLEITEIKDLVHKIDPNAFLTITETSQVKGKFKKHYAIIDKTSNNF